MERDCVQIISNHEENGSNSSPESGSPKTSPSKTNDHSSNDDCSEEINSSFERIENEESDDNQSDDESELQSESEWDHIPVLRCSNCDEEFEDKNALLEHLQTYSGKLKACSNCSTTFNNAVAYKVHKQLRLCSKLNKMYVCKLCNMLVCGISQYNYHMSAHKRNQCKSCGEHFSNRKHLELHMRNHHNICLAKDSFKCHLCDRAFSQRRSLAYHYKISHPGCHICSACLDMFDSESDLLDHVKTHKTQIFNCEKCNEQFTRRQQYLVHLKDHDKYQCLECHEGFTSKQAALKHAASMTHQVTGIALLQCAECGELFCSRALLKSHEQSVHGDMVYNCEKCKIVFKHERNYKNHLTSNEHLRDEEPQELLPCPECSKTFTNKHNLRIHILRMHRNNKEHLCTFCPYKTTIAYNLKRHLALHSEKHQFICDKCGAKFQAKSSLQEHQTIQHSNTKNFSCEKCGQQFSRNADLNKHLNNTHSDNIFTCHCGNKYKTLYNLNRHKFLSHGEVTTKQKRLKKLFPMEEIEHPQKKKTKKTKEKVKTETPKNINEDLQMLHEPIPPMSSEVVESDVMMTESHPPELLEVYNMDFSGVDKSQAIYTQNIDTLDMSELQVVESMIQMDGDHTKPGASVLINVRNLFNRSLTNDYMMESQIDPSLVQALDPSLTQTPQSMENIEQAKQDVVTIQSLQDYIIHSDLNFLNV